MVLRALRFEPLYRHLSEFLAQVVRVADEQVEAGRFTGDVRVIEALRPIAGILRRVEELRAGPDGGVGRWAARVVPDCFTSDARVRRISPDGASRVF